MPDCVHFATYEYPAAGQEWISGFNGFNFSTRLSEIDEVSGPKAASGFPAITPLSWLHDIWWRIKSFRVSASVNIDYPSFPGNNYSWSFSNIILSNPILREKNLIPAVHRVFDRRPFTEANGSNSIILAPFGRADFDLPGSSRFLRTGSSLMHGLIINFGRGAYFLNSWAPRLRSPTIFCNIHGLTVPLHIANLSHSDVSGSGSCQISVHEWWPYAAPEKILYPREGYTVGDPHPNAGLAIYDISTGTQLRDPVTGF